MGAAAPIASEGRNAPGRAHGTGTVYKCAVVPTDLSLVPGFLRFFRDLPCFRQAGKGAQERLDSFVFHADGERENTLHSQPTQNQAMVPGGAFRVPLLVQQNLLLVLELGQLLFSFGFLLQQGFLFIHGGIDLLSARGQAVHALWR